MYVQKKGVVLLITLFFITSISILMLKNLDDSNSFIKEVSQDTTLTQINITNKNVQDEVLKLVKTYQDNIDELLEISSIGIPFDYGDVNLIIKLEDYEFKDCYLNGITTTEQLYAQCNSFTTDNIIYPYDFIQLLKKYKPQNGFENQKQIDFFLDKYQQTTRDDKIEEIKENFELLKIPSNQDNESNTRYLKCSFDIIINNIKAKSEFVFTVGATSIEDGTFSLVFRDALK